MRRGDLRVSRRGPSNNADVKPLESLSTQVDDDCSFIEGKDAGDENPTGLSTPQKSIVPPIVNPIVSLPAASSLNEIILIVREHKRFEDCVQTKELRCIDTTDISSIDDQMHFVEREKFVLASLIAFIFVIAIFASILSSAPGSSSGSIMDYIQPYSRTSTLFFGDDSLCYNSNSELWPYVRTLLPSTVVGYVFNVMLSCCIGYNIDTSLSLSRALDYKYNLVIVLISLFIVPCLWWLFMLPLSAYSMRLANDPLMKSPHHNFEEFSSLQAFINGCVSIGSIQTSTSLAAAFCFVVGGTVQMHAALVTGLIVNVTRIWLVLLISGIVAYHTNSEMAGTLGYSSVMIFPLETLLCSSSPLSSLVCLIFELVVPLIFGHVFRIYYEKFFSSGSCEQFSPDHMSSDRPVYNPMLHETVLLSVDASQQAVWIEDVKTLKVAFKHFSVAEIAMLVLLLLRLFFGFLEWEAVSVVYQSPWLLSNGLLYLLLCQLVVIIIGFNLLAPLKKKNLFYPATTIACGTFVCIRPAIATIGSISLMSAYIMPCLNSDPTLTSTDCRQHLLGSLSSGMLPLIIILPIQSLIFCAAALVFS